MNTQNPARTPRLPHRFPHLLAAGALTVLGGAGFAQTNRPAGGIRPPATPAPTPQPGKTYNPSAVELDTDPWKLEPVGLTMFLPADSYAQSTTIGGKASVQVTPNKGSSTWIINIQTPRVTNNETTAAHICDTIVDEHFRAAGEIGIIRQDEPGKVDPAAVKGLLLETRKPIKIGDLTSERVYFEVPGSTATSPTVVRGITVFKTGATQFVVFELVTTKPAYEKAKPIYEATVATAMFEDPAKMNMVRAAGIAAGKKILGEHTTDRLKRAIKANPERWERCYKPAPGGADADATELGYRRIKAREGPRNANGVLGGQDDGYLVEISARMLDGSTIIDSVATYFVAKDLQSESWVVQNGIRKNNQVQSFTEQGARSDKGMVVKVEGQGIPGREVRPVFATDGYVSRVEAALLPLMLVEGAVPTDYGFYSYLSDEMNVTYRKETLEQPTDKPDLWKLTTRLSDKKPPMVSYYNAKGVLMRQELPDGAVWEPVAPEKLMQLWKTKNLPVEKQKR